MKNFIKISTVLLCLFFQNTEAKIRIIDLNPSYKWFFDLNNKLSIDENGKDEVVIKLGDTLQFTKSFNLIPEEQIPDKIFHTIDLDVFQSPAGATPLHKDWNNNVDSLLIYVPVVLGQHYFYCYPHSAVMNIRVKVVPTNVITCTGDYPEGSRCYGLNGCSSCTGIVVNYNCVPKENAPVSPCSGNIVNGTTCTGIISNSTFAGTVKNCNCLSTLTSVFDNKIENEVEIAPQIFPNPADELLEFTLDPNRKYRIEIYDINGKIIIEDGANRVSNYTLSVKELQAGKYFAKVYYCACATPKVDCSKAIKTLKFIKK